MPRGSTSDLRFTIASRSSINVLSDVAIFRDVLEDLSRRHVLTSLFVFYSIKINVFSFPNTSLAFVPGVGIKALTNHGTANISTNWDVKSPLL